MLKLNSKYHFDLPRFRLEERNLDDLRIYINSDRQSQMKFSGLQDDDRLDFDLKWAHRKVYIDKPNWKLWYIIKDNQVLGNLGFHNISIKDRRAELGYALHSEFRGNGYMSEAVQHLLQWSEKENIFIRIEAFIAPDNTPSLKLIQKMGFEKEATFRSHHFFKGHYHDSVVYALIADST